MTVRVALVGCGTVARATHLPGLRLGGDADVVAFASRSLGSAERARDAWGSGSATTDWTGAVTRDDVDAVHVCVPNALHAEVAAAALQAGKHVLVEKPITTTLADADALLALAGDRLLGVAFDGRCNPGLRELRRRLPSIGALGQVEVSFGHGGPQLWAPEATWFRDRRLSGGGCLLDLGVHVLDVLAWCVGPVVEVRSAVLSDPNDRTVSLEGTVSSDATVSLEGAVSRDDPVDEQAALELVLAGGVRARAEVSWSAALPVFRFAFEGEAGSLVLDGGDLRQDGVLVDVPPAESTTAAGDFARAVATGGRPAASGADGRAALAAALAGYASARTGQPEVVA